MKRHLKPALLNKGRNFFCQNDAREQHSCLPNMCKCTWFSYSSFWEALFPFQWRQLRADCCTQWLAGDTWCSTEEYLFISFVSAGHRLIPINGSNFEVRDFPPPSCSITAGCLFGWQELLRTLESRRERGFLITDKMSEWIVAAAACFSVRKLQLPGRHGAPETVERFSSPVMCCLILW